MGHFYDKGGILHECELKEARANGWKAGTTEIIHEFSNSYGLDLYKARQMFFASLTLPRPEGITDEQFYDLVVEDSKQHSEKAKQWGIDLHKCITQMYNDNGWCDNTFDKKIVIAANRVYTWLCQNKDSVIVDFKSQETKDGKFKQPYNEWLFQLCGYYLKGYFMDRGEYIDYPFYNWTTSGSYGGTIDYMIKQENHYDKFKLINIMISSNEDIPIKVYPWKEDKVLWGLKVFPKMVELYNIIKKLEDK